MLVGASVVAFGVMCVAPSIAAADTAPPLTCGMSQPGPCQQTLHFSDDDEFGSPLPPTAGCPSFVTNDFVHIVGPGNGIEHINVNKAQDSWFTSTFTGRETLTAYPPSSLSFDDQGNVTGITGPPDATVPVLSGKLTEWFGGQFNNRNASAGGTLNVSVSGGGMSLNLHANFHSNWAVGADQSGPPTRSFTHANCS